MNASAEQALVLAALNAPEQTGVPNLVVELMATSHRDDVSITNALVENLQRRVANAEAELSAIRLRVNELFAGDYMPTESAVMQAVFYPAQSLIDQLRADAAQATP